MIVKTSRRGGHTHSLAQLPGVVTSGWQDGLRVTSTRCRAWVKTDPRLRRRPTSGRDVAERQPAG